MPPTTRPETEGPLLSTVEVGFNFNPPLISPSNAPIPEGASPPVVTGADGTDETTGAGGAGGTRGAGEEIPEPPTLGGEDGEDTDAGLPNNC